ncbi:flagellar hook-length control protein FliK [Carnobacteriaceae bacterium 52-44]
MTFEALYEKSSEVMKEDTKDSSKDSEEVDVNEQGIPWFVWMQPSEEFADPSVKPDEGIFLETIETEEAGIIDSSMKTLQMNHSDESLINTTEVEVMKKADAETGKTVETEVNIPSEKENVHKTIEVPLTAEEALSLGKNLEKSTLITVQNSGELNNEFKWISDETMIENSEQPLENVAEDFVSAENKKVPLEAKESISSQTQVNTTFELDEALVIKEIPGSNTEEKEIQEQSTSVVIRDTEVEVSVDETIQLEFERGIEQLRNLRTVEPQVKAQEVVKVSETEWVNQVESFVVEQMESSNATEKVSMARIQLTPEHLGELEIELVLKDKGLTARLVVEHEDTKEWLELKMAELTTKLATQDIKVTDFQVSIARNEHHLADAGTQGNPFFKEQEQESKQRKTLNYSPKEEQVVEKTEKKYDANTGRVSMWV